jgi:hypothetical protein
MSTEERLFDVVFDGRPLHSVPLEKAIDGLAGLSRKQPNVIAHLFNERPTVLKRKVSEKTALKYRQALKNAGLACHITNAASPLDTEKVEKASALDVNSASPSSASAVYKPVKRNTVKTSKQMKHKAESNSSTDRWTGYWQGAVILSLLFTGLTFFLPNAKSPLQAGLLSALVFFISYPCVRFIVKLTGNSILTGIILSGIVSCGGTLAFFMCYGIVLSFVKLLRIKQFFTIYLTISIILVIAVGIMVPRSAQISRNNSHEKTMTSSPTRAQGILRQIDPAMRSYILEFGMTPKSLTRPVFKEMLSQYMPSYIANNLLQKFDNESLKLQGDMAEYRIGIYENDQWAILNERGKINYAKTF